MDIPKYVMEAAEETETKTGVKMSALLEFYQCAERHRKQFVKKQLQEINDEYTFERWWKLYGYSKSKDKCMEKWLRMTYEERKLATERTPSYVASTPDLRFRKHPTTWLNQKCWNDEVCVPEKLEEADAEKFMAYFNDTLAGTDIPMLTTMDEHRKHLLNVIYTHHKWDIPTVIEKVRDSTRLSNIDSKGRRCTFEFIFDEKNFLRILEGYYDD